MKKQQPRILIVIDVQRGFITEDTKNVPAAVEKIQDGYDVVFATRFINPPRAPFRRLLGWNDMGAGEKGAELAFGLRRDGIVIEKTGYTAMLPEITALLQRLGVDTVYLCGLETDQCVLKTAADFFEAGYRPVVLAEACASTAGEETHRSAVAILRRMIGEKQIC